MAATRSSEFGDLVQIKKQLISITAQCKERGLVHSVKWASELAFSLDPLPLNEIPPAPELTEEDARDLDALCLAKSYFDLKEYDRAAYFLRGCRSQKAYFLYMYSRYLSGEKKKDDETVDSLGPLEKGQVRNEALRELRVELSKKHSAGELDGFALYLYGVVLRKLDLLKEAVEIFVAATHALPLHWGSWLELCNLITNIEMLKSLSLPECWVRDFFMAHMFTELQMIKEALQKYQSLMEAGFAKSTYIISQIAVAYHNIRDIDQALYLFNELREQDPFRIENMDTFSNLLYVRSMKPELSYLAHNLVEIDKYRVETCCVIGNYYSLRSQHEKAALYFQRALKLNPRCLGAWTLMGHEYMEMKNTSAAIQAYRYPKNKISKDYLQPHLEKNHSFNKCLSISSASWNKGASVIISGVTCGTGLLIIVFQAREEGKALLRQISAVREQGEPSSTDLSVPCVFNPLSNNTTPVRRVSPLDLSSVTP
uniref:CDC23 (cell division cycle 23, yeast, homolog) n=1 Tax=Cyprinus carpio TaxID=7962 RepID=A0A8C2JP16_CYPCA